MHLAVALTHLGSRCALESGPVDFEWLCEVMEEHEVSLFVDQVTRESDRLTELGAVVHASLKRSVLGSRGQTRSADQVQARSLREAHEERPFDALIYGSDMNVDLAYWEPALREIPRGIALGEGAAHGLRAVWQDPGLFRRFGRRLWATAGLLSSADFLLSDVAPSSFGFQCEGRLPPWIATRSLTIPAGEPIEAGWVAVAATAEGVLSLETLIPRVTEIVPPHPRLQYLVLTRPQDEGGLDARRLLLDRCDPELERSVLVVECGDDGAAADLLEASDLVVAASPAELGVRAVADRAREVGLLMMAQGPASIGSPLLEGAPTGLFPSLSGADRSDDSVHLVTWHSTEHVQRSLQALAASRIDPGGWIVLHTNEPSGPVPALLSLLPLEGVDVALWAGQDTLFGDPDPHLLYPSALAARSELVETLEQAVGETTSLWELICWSASLEWIDRLRLLVLPAPNGCEAHPIAATSIQTRWPARSGILPRPLVIDPAPETGATESAPSPPPVHTPRRFSVPPVEPYQVSDLQMWARASRWPQRLRLALPWRWGLLERAMKDRWRRA